MHSYASYSATGGGCIAINRSYIRGCYLMLLKFMKAGSGAVGAQIVNLLALPLISRLYSPEEFAVWAIVLATAGIFGGIACFRYELAIVIPSDEEEASALFWSCGVSSLVMGILVALGSSAFFALQPSSPPDAVDSRFFVIYGPLLVTATGMTLALQYWAVRRQSFGISSASQLGSAIVALVVQVGYASLHEGGAFGLLVGSLVGQIVALIVLAAGSAWLVGWPNISWAVLRRIPKALANHTRFPKYSAPYSLFGTMRARASVYVLAMFLLPREIGLYAFAYRILNFPVSLISGALRPVIFQQAASSGSAAVEHIINRIMRWLAFSTTPLVVIFFFYAEPLFAVLFGAQWVDAAYYGKFFLIPVFTFLFCNWLDRVMDVIGQQRVTMNLEVVFSVLSIGGLWAGLFFGVGLFGALLIQSAVLIVYNVTYLIVTYDRAGYNKIELLRLASLIASVASASFLCVYFVDSLIERF